MTTKERNQTVKDAAQALRNAADVIDSNWARLGTRTKVIEFLRNMADSSEKDRGLSVDEKLSHAPFKRGSEVVHAETGALGKVTEVALRSTGEVYRVDWAGNYHANFTWHSIDQLRPKSSKG